MLKISQDIRSLTEFKRKTSELASQMKKTRRPLVLTVNGKAELVVQDAESYQELLEAADRAEAMAGIRQGLVRMKRGEARPASEVFGATRRKFGIRR